MKRLLMSAALLATASACLPHAAEAGSWLFERSYYSHTPVEPVRLGHRPPSGGPAFTRPQGGAVQAGYRWDRSQIRVGGQVVEQIQSWDSWFQVQGKL